MSSPQPLRVNDLQGSRGACETWRNPAQPDHFLVFFTPRYPIHSDGRIWQISATAANHGDLAVNAAAWGLLPDDARPIYQTPLQAVEELNKMSEYGEQHEQITAVVNLTERARLACDKIGSMVHTLWGNVLDLDDPARNAAIFTWRYACTAVDHMHNTAMEAGASAATANRYREQANALKSAALAPDVSAANHRPVIKGYREAQSRHFDIANRRAIEATAYYDVEVRAALDAAARLINQWQAAHNKQVTTF